MSQGFVDVEEGEEGQEGGEGGKGGEGVIICVKVDVGFCYAAWIRVPNQTPGAKISHLSS